MFKYIVFCLCISLSGVLCDWANNDVDCGRGEMTWHATIYLDDHTQICGGSLVSKTAVISAAHCFWKDGKQQPASKFRLVFGKSDRTWGAFARQGSEQNYDIKEIKIPDSFQGSVTNFQDDIAIVIPDRPVTWHFFAKPVCLSFYDDFEETQLQLGNLGKVAGWGNPFESYQKLKAFELPYVDFDQCYTKSPPDYRKYITNDKFCAGYGNETTTLCRNDGGGGIVFHEFQEGSNRYYLRGIVSIVASGDTLCNANTPTVFTRISKHRDFLSQIRNE